MWSGAQTAEGYWDSVKRLAAIDLDNMAAFELVKQGLEADVSLPEDWRSDIKLLAETHTYDAIYQGNSIHRYQLVWGRINLQWTYGVLSLSGSAYISKTGTPYVYLQARSTDDILERRVSPKTPEKMAKLILGKYIPEIISKVEDQGRTRFGFSELYDKVAAAFAAAAVTAGIPGSIRRIRPVENGYFGRCFEVTIFKKEFNQVRFYVSNTGVAVNRLTESPAAPSDVLAWLHMADSVHDALGFTSAVTCTFYPMCCMLD